MEYIKKYCFSAAGCLAVYWLSNSVLWIPWKISVTMGIICMLVYVPVAWGGLSVLCLRMFDDSDRMKHKFYLGICFAIVAVLSDCAFYIGYRKVPSELLKPATFGAYVLCFIMPVIVGFAGRNSQKKQIKLRGSYTLIAAVLAIAFFALTIYVTRFW